MNATIEPFKPNSVDVFELDDFCSYVGGLIDEETGGTPVRFAIQRDDHLEPVSQAFESIGAALMVLRRLDKETAEMTRVVFVGDDGEPLFSFADLADAVRSAAPLSQVAE